MRLEKVLVGAKNCSTGIESCLLHSFTKSLRLIKSIEVSLEELGDNVTTEVGGLAASCGYVS